MLFSSDWQMFVVLSILNFFPINCRDRTENGTVSSVYATKGYRSYMEDTFIRIESDRGVGIYAIFDGHGGTCASKYAAKFFPPLIRDQIKQFAKHPERCQYKEDSKLNFGPMLEAFINEYEAYLKKRFSKKKGDSGTTCLLVIAQARKLTVANVGDSRGVMCDINGTAINLSIDHKPNSPKEKERILAAGGNIHQLFENGVWRVNGLAVSRSLGDHGIELEKKFIIAVPDIFTYYLDEYRPKFMILASDGIWDVISSQDAVDFIKQRLTEKDFGAWELATHVQFETDNKSKDNITVVIVVFDENGQYKVGSARA